MDRDLRLDLLPAVHNRLSTGDGASPLVVALADPLQAAGLYLRAAGFFRSTVLELVPLEMEGFALAGGRIYLVTSVRLDIADQAALTAGGKDPVSGSWLTPAITDAFGGLIDALEDRRGVTRASLVCVASLVLAGALEAKVAIPMRQSRQNRARMVYRDGIYHDKLGIYVDGARQVFSYMGSANETEPAWDPDDGNYESVEVFRGWITEDALRVRGHLLAFKNLWANRTPGLKVVPLPEAVESRLRSLGKSIEDAWVELRRAINELEDRQQETGLELP